MNNGHTKQDIFAEIGTRTISSRNGTLVMPAPPELESKLLPMQPDCQISEWSRMEKLDSPEKLQEELSRQRLYYARFLRDLAPQLESFRDRISLRSFKWRKQTEEDKDDFRSALSGNGTWEEVTIPHYGGPLGKAVTYYRTEFRLSQGQRERGSVFIGFKGVDYKASVYLNGLCLGSHEGFFAPFEFECTDYARIGVNELLVQVENDYIFGGNESEQSGGKRYGGDKLYAATGPGYDDPAFGWHHCPPGMGIYQEVYVETRSPVHIQDLFVRPLPEEERAEAWIEVCSSGKEEEAVSFEVSVYGQNFEAEAIRGLQWTPSSVLEVGIGDSFTEANVKADGTYRQPIRLPAEKGANYFKISLPLPGARLWEPDTPWLYALQVKLIDKHGHVVDADKRQFGMRSFRQDENSEPKGKFYLNNKEIKLRGANTMGHEQQCVMNEDWEQLLDDLLLAKICNMNFLRLTQRPVQSEVYEFCDRLGLMTQTDLPLFGVLRKNKFVEAVRQAEEMERLIRSHPCNIVVSYINEPFPNAANKPHRHLSRAELERFFAAADIAVRLQNPDRVIKRVDGDYDPPTEGLPDNHCYTCWYNGHGIDMGMLHKGYWLHVKPDWHYGCGEFGAEGLDFEDVMRTRYPAEWLPLNAGQEHQWSPNAIIGAQSGRFHYFFYETQRTLADWVRESHKHQAWATRMMTEAFRRDARMNTFAIHLFIDAFPSGWMKTIMDVNRKPKPAYFAYREALSPVSVQLRSDRHSFWGGEAFAIEAWICNDTHDRLPGSTLHYQLEVEDQVIAAGKADAFLPLCSSQYQGHIGLKAIDVEQRTTAMLRLGLKDKEGAQLHETELALEIWPSWMRKPAERSVYFLRREDDAAPDWIEELQVKRKTNIRDIEAEDAIIVQDYSLYKKHEHELNERVREGAALLFMELPSGHYHVLDSTVSIKPCGMLPVHFVSRNTEHPLIWEAEAEDFKLWYSTIEDRITPLLSTTFQADGFQPILTSGNKSDQHDWEPALAAAEKGYGAGKVIICQLHMNGRASVNPAARQLLYRLLGKDFES